MSKLIVDTNLLIYAIDEESSFHDRTKKILHNSEYELYTTSKNLSEFLTVVTRGVRFPLETDDALTALDDIMANFTILYPSEDSFALFTELIRKYRPVGLRLHDFEIVSIALTYSISLFATANQKDFSEIQEIKLLDL